MRDSRLVTGAAGTLLSGLCCKVRPDCGFNARSNVLKPSVLRRLVNPSDTDAEVTISAVDDDGDTAPEGDVTRTVPAGQARNLGALALESGGEGFEGSFGDVEGKCRLTVSADRAVLVLSLVRSRWGYLASVSQ